MSRRRSSSSLTTPLVPLAPPNPPKPSLIHGCLSFSPSLFPLRSCPLCLPSTLQFYSSGSSRPPSRYQCRLSSFFVWWSLWGEAARDETEIQRRSVRDLLCKLLAGGWEGGGGGWIKGFHRRGCGSWQPELPHLHRIRPSGRAWSPPAV